MMGCYFVVFWFSWVKQLFVWCLLIDLLHIFLVAQRAEDSRGLDTSARSCEDQGSRAEDSCKLNEESNDSGDNDQNGVAILYGNKESVYKQFREDAMDRKFSRKKAVTLFIQLKDKSKKAANAKTKPEPKPFEQPGTSSSRPKGCMSSLYPPETPDWNPDMLLDYHLTPYLLELIDI